MGSVQLLYCLCTAVHVNITLSVYSLQAEALKEQSSSRVKLNVTIHAPLVCLPLSASSQSALVANLGSLKVTNKFLEACAVAEETGSGQPSETRGFVSSSGQKAIVDKMAILLTSIQLGRFEVDGLCRV